ncbi:hypothetical protein CEXT_195171 [Caerostris extrusa]|uniref:Uncharacterized protein n=1 Tax=Caerostris extrusa TaxID=172846 RepID=A0AAV4M7M6_CAEEX|nr:hypothetical protein CEXT_195171 [Caerostris extrusa]
MVDMGGKGLKRRQGCVTVGLDSRRESRRRHSAVEGLVRGFGQRPKIGRVQHIHAVRGGKPLQECPIQVGRPVVYLARQRDPIAVPVLAARAVD